MHPLALPLSLLAPLLTASLRAQEQPAQRVVEVRGHLLDDRYRPATDVPLSRLVGDPADLTPTLATPIAHSDADGAFAVKVPLDAAAPTALLVGGKRFALHRLALSSGRPLVELGFVALPRGTSSAGRVRTADGSPPRDARVTGRDLLSGPPLTDRRFDDDYRVLAPFTSCVVDQRGLFRLPGLVRSGAELRITCAGHVDHLVRPFGMDEPLDLTLRASRQLHGTVERDGAPLVGAVVSAGVVRTTTDRDGAFSLQLADPDTERLMVEVGSGIQLLRQPVDVPDGDQAMRIVVDRPADTRVWRIVAQDPNGRAIEQFDAWLAWASDSMVKHRATPLLFDDAVAHGRHQHATDGKVEFVAPTPDSPWQGALLVRAAGHGWGSVMLDRRNAGSAAIVLTLPAPLEVRGRVVDADGAPVAGVVVVPTQPPYDSWRRDLEAGADRLACPVSSPDAVTTGADGDFVLPGLPPESLELVLLLDGHCVAPLQAIDLTAGAPAAPLLLQLPRRETHAGRIVGVQRDDLEVRLFAPQLHRVDLAGADLLDGAQHLPRSGDFDLHAPTTGNHRPEVVLPRAPRNRNHPRLRVAMRRPGDFELVPLHMVEGHVITPAPWSRLAVIATQRPKLEEGLPAEQLRQIVPLEPDSTFHVLLPAVDTRFVVVDLAFGVVLHYVDVPAAKLGHAQDWRVPAVSLEVELHRATAHVDQRTTVRFKPDVALALPARAGLTTEFGYDLAEENKQRSFHLLDAWPDERFTLWLPARAGELTFSRAKTLAVPLGDAPSPLRLRVDKADVEQLR